MTALIPETTAEDIHIEGLDSPEFAARLQAEMAALDADDAQPAAPAVPRATAPDVENLASADKPADDDAKPETNEVASEDAPEAPVTDPATNPDTKQSGPDKRSKFVRENERRDRSWRALNEEKSALEKALSQFKTDQAAFVKQQSEWQEQQAKASAPSYTPELCEETAKLHEQQGEFKLAELLRAEAKRLRENPPAKVSANAVRPLSEESKSSLQRVRAEFPEFSRPDTAEHAAFRELAQQRPELLHVKDGPYLVAQHVKLHLQAQAHAAAASRVPSLEKENAELKAKLKEQESLLSISGGAGPASLPGGPRRDEDMSDEELRAEVLRGFGRG